MSVSILERLSAFFGTIWSFILTLVRSLLAFFSFQRRASSDPFTLPSVHRTQRDTLARSHARLRPILLTPRSIAHAQRTQSIRTRSAASTLFPGHDEHAATSGSTLPPTGPQRTSPKLDERGTELGLSVPITLEAQDRPSTSATSCGDGTPDTSLRTASLSVVPLTPPDKCYLAPISIPSATDCPYTEPWPTSAPLDRSKARLPGSPLKVSINTADGVYTDPMGSPPPGRWGPLQIWMSTPCKDDCPLPEPPVSPFDRDDPQDALPSIPLISIQNALLSRSRSSIPAYDEHSSASSVTSLFAEDANAPCEPERVPLSQSQSQFQLQLRRFEGTDHDAYPCAWHRSPSRLLGKPGFARRSHVDLLRLSATGAWYSTEAYLPSPVCMLSPPRGDSAIEGEDEDAVPLSQVRERIHSSHLCVRHPACTCMAHTHACASGDMSPRARRMSEGCLLALSETPTRVGVGAHTRHVVSLALDGAQAKDWLEALSLLSAEREARTTAPSPALVQVPLIM